jgi:type I restriction enzyme S subunit
MKRKVLLGELVELKYGKAFKAEDRPVDGAFPIYGSNGIVGKSGIALVEHPTIIIGRKGAVGETHLAENGCWPIDTAFYTASLSKHEFNLSYLLLCLRSIDLKKLAITSTIPGINRNTLYSQEIPLPPLPEQERIVRLLDEAESLRAARLRANERMEQFVPALFNEMFGDSVRNEKKWNKKTLTGFGATVRYGLGQPPAISEEGIPMLRATNVKRGKISTVGLIYVHREDVPSGRNAFLEADEILVVRSGAYTGDIARVGEEWKGAVAGYDLVVTPGEMFDGEFLASYLLTNFVQKEYFSSMKQRAAQPHINAQQVGNTPVFCPPLALQREFAARVGEARGVQSAQGKSGERVEALYQSMLSRAFAGEL